MTGLIIWEAAHVLSEFMLNDNEIKNRIKGSKILELGSGLGLCGFICNYL